MGFRARPAVRGSVAGSPAAPAGHSPAMRAASATSLTPVPTSAARKATPTTSPPSRTYRDAAGCAALATTPSGTSSRAVFTWAYASARSSAARIFAATSGVWPSLRRPPTGPKCTGQGRSQDLVSGGAPPISGGGPTPYFSPQTPNHKGPPLCTFGYPWISGGPGPPPPPPGYALGTGASSSGRAPSASETTTAGSRRRTCRRGTRSTSSRAAADGGSGCSAAGATPGPEAATRAEWTGSTAATPACDAAVALDELVLTRI